MVRPSQLTAMQRLLLAISLPITLLFLYFLFRKNDDEDDEEAGARVVTSRQTRIEVKVPSDSVAAVIGVRGAHIQMIKNTSNARLTFKDSEDTSKDRTLIIQGSQEGAQKAELMIRQIIADQPLIVTEVIDVPRTSVAKIIGRRGETIQLITHQSKAKIFINSEASHDQDVTQVQLKGTPIAVDVAKMLIREKVEADQTTRQTMAQSKPVDSNVTKSDNTFREVYISAVEHPGHFWVQYVDRNPGALGLSTLIDEMRDFYGKLDKPCDKEIDPMVGDIIAAPFEEDSNWYRARVLEMKKEKSTDCDSALIPLLCVHG